MGGGGVDVLELAWGLGGAVIQQFWLKVGRERSQQLAVPLLLWLSQESHLIE